jgi:sugar/nucleoside kinase (ribokinase family)
VIVVIGTAFLRGPAASGVLDGLAGRVALAAAAEGAAVELISKVGADASGDALLLALADARVGHVAVLRDPVHPTARRAELPDETATDGVADPDPGVQAEELGSWISPPSAAPSLEAADVDLALRYLTEYRVLVVVRPDPALIEPVVAAAAWSAALLVIVAVSDTEPIPALPDGAVVLSLTGDPAEGSMFGSRLGAYAAAVDRGTPSSEAFGALTQSGT